MKYLSYEKELREIILSNNWFMEVLKVVRDCNPLESCEESVSTWPETATCVGVKLVKTNLFP